MIRVTQLQAFRTIHVDFFAREQQPQHGARPRIDGMVHGRVALGEKGGEDGALAKKEEEEK